MISSTEKTATKGVMYFGNQQCRFGVDLPTSHVLIFLDLSLVFWMGQLCCCILQVFTLNFGAAMLEGLCVCKFQAYSISRAPLRDNVNDMLVTFHKSSAKDFLNSMGQEFRHACRGKRHIFMFTS